jgi:hypothetical protein
MERWEGKWKIEFKFLEFEGKTHDCRYKWRLDFPQQKLVPGNAAEECLSFDVFSVAFRRSKTTFGILAEQLERN